MEKYLVILIDSLKKKLLLLDEVASICDLHDEALNKEIPDIDRYNELMEKKGGLLENIARLDDGFVALYERISPELKRDSKDHTKMLKELQSLIGQTTDKIALIQAHELRIQSRIERLAGLNARSTSLKPARSDVAGKYKKTMTRSVNTPSIFMDKRH